MSKEKKNKFNAHEHKSLLETAFHTGLYVIKNIDDVYDVSHVDYFINNRDDIALFETYPLEKIVDNYYRSMTKLNDTVISVRLF